MTIPKPVTLGVLALQGAFREHINYFKSVIEQDEEKYSNYSINIIAVRTKEDLDKCDSLVIPGGESSSMSYIAERTNLLPHLCKFVSNESKSIWGTCAGLIFLAKEVENAVENQTCLGGLDIQVSRNAFGRQVDSFEQKLDFSGFIPGCDSFPTVFIRAPVVTRILPNRAESGSSPNKIVRSKSNYHNKAPVEVLYKLHNYDGKENELIVAVRQGRILGTSFHPELSDDNRFHQWFIDEFVL